MTPISSPRIRSVERLYDQLRGRILDGTYAPGRVLSQVGLAEELGVSRTPLREAMRRLEAEGLIEAEQNRRVRVRLVSPEELDVLLTERILLETTGIRLTVGKLSEDDLNELHLHVAAMRVALERLEVEAWEQAHSTFHADLVKYGSPKLRQSIAAQVERAERYRRQFVPMPYTPANFNPEFEAILGACVIRNADLAARRIARMLSKVALAVLALASPEYEPQAIRAAMTMLQVEANEPASGTIRRS